MRAVRLTLAAFALLLVGLSSSANAAPSAATQGVSIATFAFSPAAVTINIGDSVRWTNNDPAVHTVTANGGAFNSGNLNPNATFTFQFGSAGTFAYHCAIHPSMTGSVIVRSAATAPPTTTPTAPTTIAPTARPTVAPTPQPTVAPTAQPTEAPTPEPTVAPTPTIAPTQTAAPTTTAPVGAISPSTVPATDSPRATPGSAQEGPPVVLFAGAAAIVLGLGALAWVLLRR